MEIYFFSWEKIAAHRNYKISMEISRLVCWAYSLIQNKKPDVETSGVLG
jgi:hypothetical protein